MFFMAILSDHNRVQLQGGLPLQSTVIEFDPGDVDDRMDEERCREDQFDCIRQDCGDMIRPDPFLDQLPYWIGKSEIGHR